MIETISGKCYIAVAIELPGRGVAQTRASADGRVIEGLEMKRLFAAIAGLISSTSLAGALTLVAVVEDVQGNVSGAELMDYVAPGQVIKLGPGGMIVLGYMKSCWRETISGAGAVIVGTEQSGVQLADVKAEKVPCDPKQSDKVGREVGESAAAVVRSAKSLPGAGVVMIGDTPCTTSRLGFFTLRTTVAALSPTSLPTFVD